MRRFFQVLSVITVVGLLLFAVGCGGGDATKGQVDTDNDGAMAEGNITENELGVPIYPGAVPDKAVNMKSNPEELRGKIPWAAGLFYTNDPVVKVIEYYRTELSSMPGFKDMSVTNLSEPMGMIGVTSQGKKVTITIMTDLKDKSRTSINIMAEAVE